MPSYDAQPGGPADDAPRPLAYQPFAHLTAGNAVLYRQVMGVFARAKERFAVHLRPEDVHTALPPDHRPTEAAELVTSLDKLVEWGNLRADPDTGRVTAVEDFYRRRLIYQVTREGEAAEEALAAYDEALGRRGALQAVALTDIVTQLRALEAQARSCTAESGTADPAVVHLALSTLVGRFTDLAENARAFMGSLQRTIDLHDAEIDAFLAYKDHLIDYLERFIQELITRGSEIAGILEGLDPEPLLRAAAARESSDAAPEDSSEAAEEAYEAWAGRWDGLRAWFLSAPGRESQARLLRGAARAAIPQLLAVVRSLNERRSGRSDRSADFRTLARWFATAPDDAARHRLWRSAFGLYSARHLSADPDAEAPEQARTNPPWAEAEPLRISPQLRRTGSYERRGRNRKVTDRSESRAYLAELARRQTEQTAAARARLATGGKVRLSELRDLDTEAFQLFLQLLGDALAGWRPGTREVVAGSHDGSMEIRMTALDGGGTAHITTESGTFHGPDHLVEIVDLTGGALSRRHDPGVEEAV